MMYVACFSDLGSRNLIKSQSWIENSNYNDNLATFFLLVIKLSDDGHIWFLLVPINKINRICQCFFFRVFHYGIVIDIGKQVNRVWKFCWCIFQLLQKNRM